MIFSLIRIRIRVPSSRTLKRTILEVREGIQKLVIVITDGRSSHSPRTVALKLRDQGIPLIAISMSWNPDEKELLDIAGDSAHVFTPNNLQVSKRFVKSAFLEFRIDFLELCWVRMPWR